MATRVLRVAGARRQEHRPDVPPVRVASLGPRRAVLKYHFLRGRIVGELLIAGDGGTANGYVLDLGRGEVVPRDHADAERIAKRFSPLGERYVRPLRGGVPVRKMAQVDAARLDLQVRGVGDHYVVTAAEGQAELGMWDEHVREFFFKGEGLAGTLRLAKCCGDCGWSLEQPADPTPLVVQHTTAKRGLMPGEGLSALPASLEAAVPEPYRYWLHKGEEARARRDALVEAAFFTAETVAVVGGELRRVVTKRYLYAPPVHKGAARTFKLDTFATRVSRLIPATFDSYVHPMLVEDWRGAVAKADKPGTMFVLSPPDGDASVEEIAQVASGLAGEWLIDVEDTPAARAALAKVATPFVVASPLAEGHLFAASFPVGGGVEWVRKEETAPVAVQKPFAGFADFAACHAAQLRAGHSDDSANNICGALQRDAEKAGKSVTAAEQDTMQLRVAKHEVRKDDAGTDQRYVLGIVLEPETVDGQNDVYSADEVANAAHTWLAKYQNRGYMHEKNVNDKVQLAESYIAPVDFSIGDQQVKKGTWMLAYHVLDDGLWNQVKKGELTGFSIGGSAVRVREKRAPAAKAGIAVPPEVQAKIDANPKVKQVKYQGIDVTLDRPAGYTMVGKDAQGNTWVRTYVTDYGYIAKTEGGDGEDLDVFLGPLPEADLGFWVLQKKQDGSFDEFKLFLGYATGSDVRKVYNAHIPAQYWSGVFATPVSAIKSLLGLKPDVLLKRLEAHVTGNNI